jgi:hypothetical protein
MLSYALVFKVGDFVVVVPDVCVWFGSPVIRTQLAIGGFLVVEKRSTGEIFFV